MSTVEKALSQLQSGLTAIGGGGSRAFQNLIRGIGEAKTRDEEDRIIRREVVALKELTAVTGLSPKQKKEVLVRLLYCEMLGHDVSFGHIYAVKFAQQNTLMEKRVGYLATALFLHDQHELTLLVVNSLQKDLESTNILVVCSALTVISKIIGADMVPVFVPLVRKKLGHAREIIRKKVVMTLHRFWLIAPAQLPDVGELCRQMLCDRDPGVMAACLHLLHDLIAEAPQDHTDLVSSFVSILKQIVEGRLPHDFDYHSMPSPWTQMKLLRILAMLGADDLRASESMYEVLELTLLRSDTGSAIGYAVTYEVIRTITAIYPNSQLVEKAAKSLSRFLTSQNNNYKYFGITLLASIVQVNPQYAAEHQMVVINCLEDPDETLKRKTLDLLYRMTNPHNVEVICERLISYLRSTVDDFLRSDLVARLTELAERFAPSNAWFVETMSSVFELGGSLVPPEVAHNLMRLLAEGTEDDDQDLELRLYAVESYMELIEKPQLPDVLIKVMSWVLGEYSYLSEDYTAKEVLDKLCAFLDRHVDAAETRNWVVTAISKIVSQQGQLPGEVWARVSKFMSSAHVDMQQRCYELKLLSMQPALMQQVLPKDASCEDLEVDGSLSFLDDFVSDALVRGCAAYKPASQRMTARPVEEVPEEDTGRVAGLNVTPYDAPSQSKTTAASLFSGMTAPSAVSAVVDGHAPVSPAPVSTVAMPTTAESTGSADDSRSDGTSSSGLKGSPQIARQAQSGVGVAGPRLWGRGGYAKKATTSAAAPAEPVSSGEGMPAGSGAAVSSLAAGPVGTTGKAAASVGPTAADSVGGAPITEEEKSKRELAGAIFGMPSAGRGAGMLTGRAKTRAQKRKEQQQQQQAAESGAVPSNLTQANVAAISATNSLDPNASVGGVAASNQIGNTLLDLDFLGSSSPAVVGGGGGVAMTQASGQTQQPGPSLLDLDWGDTSLSGAPAGMAPTAPVDNTSDLWKPAAAQPSMAPVVDLLGGMDIATQPSAAAPSGAVPVSIVQPSVAPSMQSTQPQPASNTGASGFSFLSSSPAPLDSGVCADLPEPLSATPNATQLPAELLVYPHSSNREEVCTDGSVRLAVQRVWKPDAAVLVFFITNTRQTDLADVKLQAAPPSGFQAEYVGSQAGLAGWPGVTVPASQTIRHVLALTGKAVAKVMSMKGELTYQIGSDTAAKVQLFNINVLLEDLLRPLEISTSEFGSRWGSTSHESKSKMSSGVGDPAAYMERIKSNLHMHPVQIIGNEAIAAGTVLNNPGTQCLVHSKIAPGQIELWVRTASGLLTQCVVALCSTTFKT